MLFNRHKTDELIVKPRSSPLVKLFAAGLIVLALLAIGGMTYNRGLSMGDVERLAAWRQQELLQDQIGRLKAEKQRLRESLVRAKTVAGINRTAYFELDKAGKASTQEIAKLREELDFYRNIISPPDKRSGLRVQSLKLEPAADDANTYHYKMVLIQALKHDRKIRGRARFEIGGFRAGDKTVLQYPNPADRSIRFNFKYFQEIKGRLEIPYNFEPQWIKLHVTSRGRNAQTMLQTYVWQELLSSSTPKRAG